MHILFETTFGSHIYGTSTPQSDRDLKGIYQASYRDIILDQVHDSIVTTTRTDISPGVRNQSSDTDIEYKELRKFINDAIAGQTYALDMLYTPAPFWTRHSQTWLDIVHARRSFLSKQMRSFLGYIRQQTGKYAMKGTRMSAIVSTVEYLEKCPPKQLLHEVWDGLLKNEFVRIQDQTTQPMLEVLGKKYPGTIRVGLVLENLQRFYTEFGARSRQALVNEGVDWKAISHAYRACYQLIDIATQYEIVFPLKQAAYVRTIKLGQVSYRDVVQEELPQLMDQAIDRLQTSTLPEVVDRSYWDEFMVKTYAHAVPSVATSKASTERYHRYLRKIKPDLPQDPSLPPCIISDLDGTLAVFDASCPYDRDFSQDRLHQPVARILRAERAHSDTTIILVSARDDQSRSQTEAWLRQHAIPYDALYMRPTGDQRKDVELKREIYTTHIKGKYQVVFVLDDRDQVVEFWRSQGLTCLQVAEGDF